MTYRKCGSTCLFFRSIQRFVRHLKWTRIEPVGRICWNSNRAIIKHFADGKY